MRDIGGYSVLFPTWWQRIESTDQPPMHRLASVPANNMTFDITVLKGLGSEEEIARFIEQTLAIYKGSDLATDIVLQGVPFTGVLTSDPEILSGPAGTFIEHYVAPIDGDLLAFSISQYPGVEHGEVLRELTLRMVEGAIARKQSQLP